MKIFMIEFKKIVQKLRVFPIAELQCKLVFGNSFIPKSE